VDNFFLIDHFFAKKSNLFDASQEISIDRSDYIFVWATYSLGGNLSLDEKIFLRRLKSYPSVEIIVVINTSTKFLELPKREFQTLLRPNRGRDLAAFRDALQLMKNVCPNSTVILLNSSCIWSADKIMDVLAKRINQNSVNFMSDSYQGTYHMQSYFLAIPYNYLNLTKDIFKNNIRNWRFKRSAVIKGEKRLHKYLGELSIPINVLYPATVLEKSTGLEKSDTNYSKDCAYELLKLGAPFLKKSSSNSLQIIAHLNSKPRDIE